MTNPLRRNGHGITEQHACAPTSSRCCGPTQKPDLRDVVCCGHHANDSHTGVRWMLLLNHAKILCSLGDDKVASRAALSAFLRRFTHITLAHKTSSAQSHVLGAHVHTLSRPNPKALLYATLMPNRRPKETKKIMGPPFMGAMLNLHFEPNAPIENSATYPRHQEERVDSHPRFCPSVPNAKPSVTGLKWYVSDSETRLINLSILAIPCVQMPFL